MALFGIGGGASTKTTSFNQQTDPWDETIPQLREFLARIEPFEDQGFGLSPEQQQVFAQLKANLASGNPNAADIQTLASNLFNSQSGSPALTQAFSDFQRRLAPTADNQGFEINPYLQQALDANARNIFDQVNSQFAAAGRDLSGYNTAAAAKA